MDTMMALFRRSRSALLATARSPTPTPAGGGAAERLVRGLKGGSGQALIEMALVLPAFFLLLFGLFTFSIILFGYVNATFACQLGARYASLHSSTSIAPCSSSSITTLVTPYLWAAAQNQVTVATNWSPGNTVGSTVSVSVTIVYPIGIPFFSQSQITAGSTAQRTITR
jgi:Flp pilus assembly protein TadG